MLDEDETHSPNTQHLSESQEIVVGNSGRAILLGDELDLESVHGRSAPYPATKKRGPCPAWLQSSSPKMKAILGIIAIVLLAFVVVLITGATQISDGSGSSAVQSDKNVVTDLLETTPAPTPRRSPSPTTTKDDEGISSSSSTPNDTVSAVNIQLPDSLESKIPNFADGLSANEQRNWDILEERIENTIIEAFSDRLPEGFSLESVQIEKFDGYDTTSMRRQERKNTRHLQTNSDSSAATSVVHSVLYASSITVDCAASDCSTAADIVAEITSELSQLEFLKVEDAVETVAPAGSTIGGGGGGSPTESPITSISSSNPTTLAPSVVITMEPSSGSPTQAVTNATEAPLPLYIREELCTVDSLCGRCEGKWPITNIQRKE